MRRDVIFYIAAYALAFYIGWKLGDLLMLWLVG